MGNLHHYLELAKPLLDQYGYLALFTSIFVEGFGIPAPGQTLLIASAVLAGKGQLSIAMVLITAWLATFLGNSVGYGIGVWGGKKLFARLGETANKHLAKVEYYFAKYDGGVVIGARFFEVLRQLSGIVAGTLGMPWLRFTMFNAIGATLWVGVWGLGVYWIGEHMGMIKHALITIEPLIIVLGVGALLAGVWYIFIKR